jgi:hypothetical protein
MRTFLKISRILCLFVFAGATLAARADDEKPVQIPKERLWGVWRGYDTNNGVVFRVEFTNDFDHVIVGMQSWHGFHVRLCQFTQEAPDKPFKISDWGTVVGLPNDRLRITVVPGLVLPWVPNEAILERVKPPNSK